MFIKSLVETIISMIAAIYLCISSVYKWVEENTDKEDWVVIIGVFILGNFGMFLIGCMMCILKP